MKKRQKDVNREGILWGPIASAHAGASGGDRFGCPYGKPVGDGGRTGHTISVRNRPGRGPGVRQLVVSALLLWLWAAPAHGTLSIGGFSTIRETFDSFNPPAGQDPVAPQPYVYNGDWTYSGTDFKPGGFYTLAAPYHNENSTYGLRSTASSADIAFGNKMGVSEGPFYLTLHAQNNSGAAITGFRLGWNVEQYSLSGRGTMLDFDWSTDGLHFNRNNLTGGSGVIGLTGSPGNLGSVVSTPIAATIVQDLAAGQDVYFRFRWAVGRGTGDNVHIGIDDFSVTAVPEPSTYLAGGLAVGLLALTIRNRDRRGMPKAL